MRPEFEVKDDLLIKHVPIPQARTKSKVYTSEVVLDKETFIKCFNEWIVAEVKK